MNKCKWRTDAGTCKCPNITLNGKTYTNPNFGKRCCKLHNEPCPNTKLKIAHRKLELEILKKYAKNKKIRMSLKEAIDLVKKPYNTDAKRRIIAEAILKGKFEVI